MQALFDSSEPDSHAFIFFVLYNGALVLVGSLLTVFVEPSAAAGGMLCVCVCVCVCVCGGGG